MTLVMSSSGRDTYMNSLAAFFMDCILAYCDVN